MALKDDGRFCHVYVIYIFDSRSSKPFIGFEEKPWWAVICNTVFNFGDSSISYCSLAKWMPARNSNPRTHISVVLHSVVFVIAAKPNEWTNFKSDQR